MTIENHVIEIENHVMGIENHAMGIENHVMGIDGDRKSWLGIENYLEYICLFMNDCMYYQA